MRKSDDLIATILAVFIAIFAAILCGGISYIFIKLCIWFAEVWL